MRLIAREMYTDTFAIELADGMRVDTIVATHDGYFASMENGSWAARSLNETMVNISSSMMMY